MPDETYDEALARAATIYPGLKVGRPGRSRLYRPTKAALHLSRLRYAIDVDGIDNVDADRPAIIVGNHLSALDPVVGVVRSPWRVAAFTKVEAYESGIGFFFRLMGQIPLRRGDEDSTAWALDMAQRALADGSKVAIYPEGTRGPDAGAMYRLHQRLLVPLLTANPDVPVHAIATTYPASSGLPCRRAGPGVAAAAGRRAHDVRRRDDRGAARRARGARAGCATSTATRWSTSAERPRPGRTDD